MSGIVGYGVHLPALRLQREQVLAAHGWFNPALAPLARGERAVCNWDEDALTMAVEAARCALAPFDRGQVQHVMLASTTLPYEDRLGSAVLTRALGLSSSTMPLDLAGSPRAALTAMRTLLRDDAHPSTGLTLCIASDNRKARPASTQEMLFGAGAVALVLGDGRPIVQLLGSHSHTTELVDRFRARGREYEFQWEERWIRDEGHLRIIPDTARALMTKLGLAGSEVHHLVVPLASAGAGKAVAGALNIRPECVVDNLVGQCGDVGAAYPLLMLVAALERASPGERILVCAFGQGCDALLFQATDELVHARAAFTGVSAALAERSPETNYLRYLVGAGQLDVETGMRGETSKLTPLSVAYRERETLLGFIGGRCRTCGTCQFPRSEACVNPACHATGEQDPVDFSERRGRVLTWTADHLAFSLRPPAYYGIVEFEGGGRTLLEFADADVQAPGAGSPVRMVFRIRRIDPVRGWRSYFWKAKGVAA